MIKKQEEGTTVAGNTSMCVVINGYDDSIADAERLYRWVGWCGLMLQNSPVEAAVRCYGDRDITWSSQGMLRLTPRAMKRLFQPTVEHIKQLIGSVLNEPSLKGTNLILHSDLRATCAPFCDKFLYRLLTKFWKLMFIYATALLSIMTVFIRTFIHLLKINS